MTTLALVGKGKWGKNYIHAISGLYSCRLPEEYIKTFNYKDLFNKKDIDGVIIATPSSTHFQIAKDFLQRRFNLLIEKPITTSLSDALELKEIHKKYNSVVMVGHIFRYNSAFIKLTKRLGDIGKIKSVKSVEMNLGPFRPDVSALWDYGPHDISMISSFLGSPVAVSAKDIGKNANDIYNLRIKFPNGIMSSTHISRVSKTKRRNVVVTGEEGELYFNDLLKEKLIYRSFKEKKSYALKLSNKTPLENQLLEFLDCINTNRNPKTDLEEGILTVRVLEAAEESIKKGGIEVSL